MLRSVVVQSLSRVFLFVAPSTEAPQPGSRVLPCLLEAVPTLVHRVGDAIQPSHPLLSPSPPAFSLSQHQGLFQGVSSSGQSISKESVLVAKVLEFQLQYQSFQ